MMQIYTPSQQVGNAIGQGLTTLGRAFAEAQINGPLRREQMALARARAQQADYEAKRAATLTEGAIAKNQREAEVYRLAGEAADAVARGDITREQATAVLMRAMPDKLDRVGAAVRGVLPSNRLYTTEEEMRLSAGQGGDNPQSSVRYTAQGALERDAAENRADIERAAAGRAIPRPVAPRPAPQPRPPQVITGADGMYTLGPDGIARPIPVEGGGVVQPKPAKPVAAKVAPITKDRRAQITAAITREVGKAQDKAAPGPNSLAQLQVEVEEAVMAGKPLLEAVKEIVAGKKFKRTDYGIPFVSTKTVELDDAEPDEFDSIGDGTL